MTGRTPTRVVQTFAWENITVEQSAVSECAVVVFPDGTRRALTVKQVAHVRDALTAFLETQRPTQDPTQNREPDPVPFRTVAATLNRKLGPTLVASLAGSKYVIDAHSWASGVERPGKKKVRRIRFAYTQWLAVAEAESPDVARAWFVGANPWLDDAPVNAIREDRFVEVERAVKALVDDTFSG